MSKDDIANKLDRIERKINMLIEKAYRPLWVKASVVTSLTGWSNEKMRQAREHGYIKFENRGTEKKCEFWYDLNSLPQHFIKR